MMRAIFLDRDGVICKNRTDHVKTWDEFQFLPGAKKSLAALSKLGLPIIIVTNQAAINRGLTTVEAVEEIHSHMVAEIQASGGRIDKVMYCPHRPDEHCNCRKPESGMLQEAANELDINLNQSYMVGDALTDLQAGLRVGAKLILVLTGRGLRQLLPARRTLGNDFFVAQSIIGATVHILGTEITNTHSSFSKTTPTKKPVHG